MEVKYHIFSCDITKIKLRKPIGLLETDLCPLTMSMFSMRISSCRPQSYQPISLIMLSIFKNSCLLSCKIALPIK